MIPKFPEFKNLEISDKEEIENITKPFPPHSDFHFISIYCWDIDNSTLISILNNNLILKQIDCLTGEQFYSFIGTNSVPQTIKEISAFLHQNNLPLILRWIPQETIACLNGTQATITEDRDYFDYIYNVSDLYHAEGGKYYDYRRMISRFTRKYINISTRIIDLSNSEVKEQINSLFNIWTQNKETEHKECEPSFEHKALNKLLSSAHEFKTLVAIGVYDKEEMIGFYINDLHDNEYGSFLFGKANLDYQGVYQYLMKETINLYYRKGIRFVSFESDLGIESLRTSKLHYKPAFFLKKYSIEMSNFATEL